MSTYVLDSYALLAYFRAEAGAAAVEQLLNDAASGKKELLMTSVNVGEVYYMAFRKNGQEKAELVWKLVRQFPITIVDADLALTYNAAKLKAKNRLSYADAFAAALTIQKKGTLITGDKEFENLKEEANFKVEYL